jgi:hypothetical protein
MWKELWWLLWVVRHNQNDRTSRKQPRTFTSTGRQQKALWGGKDTILSKSLQMKVDITIGLLLQKYRPASQSEPTTHLRRNMRDGWWVDRKHFSIGFPVPLANQPWCLAQFLFLLPAYLHTYEQSTSHHHQCRAVFQRAFEIVYILCFGGTTKHENVH